MRRKRRRKWHEIQAKWGRRRRKTNERSKNEEDVNNESKGLKEGSCSSCSTREEASWRRRDPPPPSTPSMKQGWRQVNASQGKQCKENRKRDRRRSWGHIPGECLTLLSTKFSCETRAETLILRASHEERKERGREKKYKKISSLLQNQKPLLFFLRIHLRQNWISYATHVPSASFVIRLQGTSYYTMYTRRRNRKRPKRDLHETGMRDPASQTIPGEDGHPLESREDEERTRREKKGHTKYFLKNVKDQIPVFVKKEKILRFLV